MFEKKNYMRKFLKDMNFRHQNVKLTFEKKHNNKIAFLYKPITRVGNELQISLFRKKAFSGVYLKFNSHLPCEYKKSLLHTLLYRIYNFCSNYANLHQEIVSLKPVFPLFFIDKCAHKFFNKSLLKRHHLKPLSEKKEVIISLEF